MSCCTNPSATSPVSPPVVPADETVPPAPVAETPTLPKSPLLVLLEARLASHTELHHAHGEARQLAAAKGRVGRPHPSPGDIAAARSATASPASATRSLETSPSSPSTALIPDERRPSSSPISALVLPLLPVAAESLAEAIPSETAGSAAVSADNSAAAATAPEDQGPTTTVALDSLLSKEEVAPSAAASKEEAAPTAASLEEESQTAAATASTAPVLVTCVIADAGALGLAIENASVGGGCIVRKVTASGLAEAAGLRVDDTFDSINGEVVRDSNFAQVQTVLKKAGRPIQVIVLRRPTAA